MRRNGNLTRRQVVAATAAALIPAPEVWAQSTPRAGLRRNLSALQAASLQDHFDTLRNGAILADTQSKVLQYWSGDQSVYRRVSNQRPTHGRSDAAWMHVGYPQGRGPSWRPTPATKKRNPAWPDYVGPGPENPLGTHALYLGWQYDRILGTNDTCKIGRRSPNGCIGLYNEQITELFALAQPGTQVKLI